MFENIRMSFKGIWSHKMRSFLTMLGIIIGIAAIIAIVSTIKGTNEQIKQNLIGSGNNTVKIQLNQGDYEYEMDDYSGIPEGVTQISDATMKKINNIDKVVSASRFLRRTDYNGYVYYMNNSLSGGSVTGVDQNYFETLDYVIREGRGFSERDYDNYNKVAILDEDSVETLFPGVDPVGKTIEINKEPFVIIGIVTPKASFEPTITSEEDYYTYYQETAGSVYIPSADWPIIFQFD